MELSSISRVLTQVKQGQKPKDVSNRTILAVVNGRTIFSELDGNILGYQAILDSMKASGFFESVEEGLEDDTDHLRLNHILRLKTDIKICPETKELLLESVWFKNLSNSGTRDLLLRLARAC